MLLLLLLSPEGSFSLLPLIGSSSFFQDLFCFGLLALLAAVKLSELVLAIIGVCVIISSLVCVYKSRSLLNLTLSLCGCRFVAPLNSGEARYCTTSKLKVQLSGKAGKLH